MLINSSIKSLQIAGRSEMHLEKCTYALTQVLCFDKDGVGHHQSWTRSHCEQKKALLLVKSYLQTPQLLWFVHSVHSWGIFLRPLVMCCRHLKPDLCSALCSSLLMYLPGRAKRLGMRLSEAMGTGNNLLSDTKHRRLPGQIICAAVLLWGMKRAARSLAAHCEGSPHFLNEVAQIQSELTVHRTSLQQTLPAAGLYLSCWWKEAEETGALLLHNICPCSFLKQELLSHPYHHEEQWTHTIIPHLLSHWCIKKQGLALPHFHFSKKHPQKGYLPTQPPSSPKNPHSKTWQSPLVSLESSATFLMIHCIQLFIYFPPNGTTFLYN